MYAYTEGSKEFKGNGKCNSNKTDNGHRQRRSPLPTFNATRPMQHQESGLRIEQIHSFLTLFIVFSSIKRNVELNYNIEDIAMGNEIDGLCKSIRTSF